jgi:hypothetical protein
MRKDLSSTINQTKDVEGLIRSASLTPQKRNKFWIIVESDYDCDVYEHFFNDNVVVKPSNDENRNGGCDRVVCIVNNILRSGETQRIIGVRDADYMYYFPRKFTYPANILHTDDRDIEMMMLKSTSVQRGLALWNALFPAKIAQVIPIACYMGLIRIWHVAHDIRASIKKLRLTRVWNERIVPQGPKLHWKRDLINKYNRLTGEQLNPKKISYIKNRYGLDNNQYNHICRGHDFVQLLGVAMVNSKFGSSRIQTKIAEVYSQADFVQTNLAHNIERFANGCGLRDIWK